MEIEVSPRCPNCGHEQLQTPEPNVDDVAICAACDARFPLSAIVDAEERRARASVEKVLSKEIAKLSRKLRE